MKKTIITLMLALAGIVAASSCGNGESATDHNDSVVSNQLNDSIMNYYGRVTGGYIASQLDAYAQQTGDTLDKVEYLKGLKYLLNKKYSDDFLSGVAGAMKIIGDMDEFSKMGITFDRDKVIKSLELALQADSVDGAELQKLNLALSDMLQGVAAKAENRRLDAIRKSPEAVKNDRSGKAAADAALKKEAGAKRTASGIVAIVATQGKGEIKDDAHLRLNMKSMHINGDVWQSVDTQQVVVPRGMTPGYAEAVRLLGIGGKGRFYIPADLAYGPAGIEQAGVGPMEWMIVDLEVVSVDDPGTPAEPAK